MNHLSQPLPAYQRLPALFISHGAPTVVLEQSSTTQALERMGKNLPKPKAAVVMSAHWQSTELLVSTSAWPRQWHDYQLPQSRAWQSVRQNMQRYSYRPKGDPNLAEQVLSMLHANTISAFADGLHPTDHGVWAPLSLMYPNQDVPVVQLSLPRSASAESLMKVGQALSELQNQGVLLIGSGSVTHNLNLSHRSQHSAKQVMRFANWLIHTLSQDQDAALQWQDAPGAKEAHPTSEHLLPLFFAYGAAQNMSVVHRRPLSAGVHMDIYRFD